MIIRGIHIDDQYTLNLSNSHRWYVSSSDNTRFIINDMIGIMGLKCAYNNTFSEKKLDEYVSYNMRFLNVDDANAQTLDRLDSIKITINPQNNLLMEFRYGQDGSFFSIINNNRSPENDVLKICYSVIPIYLNEIKDGGLPLHSAFIEYNNMGILLAAHGGIGKSTCCNRLPKQWDVLCDDETLIVRTADSIYNSHPFPTWSNLIFGRKQKTWDVQRYHQLNAIFFIEQSPYDEVLPIGKGDASYRIYNSSLQVMGRFLPYLSKDKSLGLKKQLFNNACEISKSVSSYVLKVSLHGTFWEEIEKVVSK